MHRLTILLLIASCLFVAQGVIETTSLPGTPIAPSGTVCIQVICPDPGDGDPTVCPERCNGACTTITNACCPQSVIAVCAGEPTPGASTSAASGPAPTSASSPAESSPTASSPSIQSSPASSTSSPPAETTDASENPEDGTNALSLPYYVLPLVVILVIKLLLL